MSPEQVTWLPAWEPEVGAARATRLFRDTFGREPAGVWAGPGRVNLIGEHTDYNAGLCLPVALPHRTYVALRPRPDDTVHLVSAQEGESWRGALTQVGPGMGGWAGYLAGVAWAMRDLGPIPGFEAAVDSCVPYGAGLSSSAALECAAAVALDYVLGTGLAADDDGRARLAALCQQAENEVAGAPTGGLDQAAALRTRAGHALLLDFRDGTVRHIPAPLDDHTLLVVDTRAPHRLADGQYADRRSACERAAALLGVATLREVGDLAVATETLLRSGVEDAQVLARRVRHVVTENQRVAEVARLLEGFDPAAVGGLLNAGHASLRDDYQVSCPELDLAADVAVTAGALGARMVGGGFGGSVLTLVARPDVEAVAVAVSEAFRVAGHRAPAFLVTEPAGPAGSWRDM